MKKYQVYVTATFIEDKDYYTSDFGKNFSKEDFDNLMIDLEYEYSPVSIDGEFYEGEDFTIQLLMEKTYTFVLSAESEAEAEFLAEERVEDDLYDNFENVRELYLSVDVTSL